MEKVSQEIHRIHVNCGCDYLDDLLTAVFIAHTKVLTAIRIGQPQKKVEINIPKVDHFLFKVLCESAKLLWGSTYLFRDSIPSVEKQQNYRIIEGMLNEGILQAVRTLVPVKSILKDFVNQDSTSKHTELTEEDSDEEDESETDKKDKTAEDIPSAPSAPSVSSLSSVPIIDDPLSAPSVASLSELDSKLEDTTSIPPVISLPSTVTPLSVIEETKQEAPAPPQMIVLDDKPSVRFGQFDAVFDSDHPSDSDMIYDPKESETEEGIPDLEIMDENGVPLSEGLDFDSLENSEPSGMDANDYEEL
jgi:hypothetical protein